MVRPCPRCNTTGMASEIVAEEIETMRQALAIRRVWFLREVRELMNAHYDNSGARLWQGAAQFEQDEREFARMIDWAETRAEAWARGSATFSGSTEECTDPMSGPINDRPEDDDRCQQT